MRPVSRYIIVAFGLLLGMASSRSMAAETPSAESASAQEKSASGTFVSFNDGTLRIQGRSGVSTYRQVGGNYQTFQNNEDGPGSKLVHTVEALRAAVPGTFFQVKLEEREILFGLDHRVIGTFESYLDGKLSLLAAEASPGFMKKPSGRVVMAIDPRIPVLESISGGNYIHAGTAGTILPKASKGALITARSEANAEIIEVIQIGEPKRKIERYVGQTRATVRGAFVSFKDGVLRLRGKGVAPLTANEYERMMAWRIAGQVPIFESIDSGAYEPARPGALQSLKEGEIVTIRKVEEVILEVQIGLTKK